MPLCELERLAVRSCCKQLVDDLDVKEILPYLYQTGDVDEDTAIQIEKENRRRTNTLRFLLNTIRKCSFENFLRSLQDDHGFLADKIRHNLNTVVRIYMDSVSPSEALVHAVHSPRCFKVQKSFNQIHHLYDNGQIAAFRNEFQKVEKLWYNRETLSERAARMTSDLYCMLLRVQYRHNANEGENNVHGKMLQKFQKVLPHTSDQNRFTIIMLSEKARVLSTLADIPEASSTAKDVIQLSTFLQNGEEAIESNITCSTVELYQTERNRTSENRKSHVASLMKIRDMINDLGEESKEDHRETEATMYVMAALTLININEDGKDLGSEDLTQEDISLAKQHFSCVEKEQFWNTLSNCWKAVTFLGKAKVAILDNNINKAKEFLDYARYCSSQVEYRPYMQENIKEFEEKNLEESSVESHCTEEPHVSGVAEGAHETLYKYFVPRRTKESFPVKSQAHRKRSGTTTKVCPPRTLHKVTYKNKDLFYGPSTSSAKRYRETSLMPNAEDMTYSRYPSFQKGRNKFPMTLQDKYSLTRQHGYSQRRIKRLR